MPPALIDDPSLLDRILRQFRVKGRVNPFEIGNVAVPTFDIGELAQDRPVTEVVTPDSTSAVRIGLSDDQSALTIKYPPHLPTETFSDQSAAPGAASVLADTGQLAASEFFLQFTLSHDDAALRHIEIQWRNAANTATLATYPIWVTEVTNRWLNVDVALNERFRLVNITAIAGLALSFITVGRGRDAVD